MSFLIRFVFLLSLGLTAEASPKYGAQAVRMFLNHQYLQKNTAVDYWSMAGYYVPQFNNKACSVASVSMIVNAARAKNNLTASDELVTQDALLKKVGDGQWSKAVGITGRGVPLERLGQFTQASLEAYGLKEVQVQVIHSDGSKKTNDQILSLLAQNEKSGDDLILANFLQSEFTGDPEAAVGHIAPVAAYDEKTKQVLIFDPDRQYYEPYWVSSEVFLKGLTTEDPGEKKKRGIVYVSFKR